MLQLTCLFVLSYVSFLAAALFIGAAIARGER